MDTYMIYKIIREIMIDIEGEQIKFNIRILGVPKIEMPTKDIESYLKYIIEEISSEMKHKVCRS